MRVSIKKTATPIFLAATILVVYQTISSIALLQTYIPGSIVVQVVATDNSSGITAVTAHSYHDRQSHNRTTVPLLHGYDLAKSVSEKCKVAKYKVREKVFMVYEHEKVQTCTIWKIGSTFLRRLYMTKKLPKYKNVTNPYDIFYDEPFNSNTKTISNSAGSSRFMFVRNPYNRILSAYVDKLLAPNPVYWKIIGVPAIKLARQKPSSLSIKCGHDLQFQEFVQYVFKAMDPRIKKPKPDGHFDKMTALCKPCAVKYDFIGKMETFAEDSIELARRLGASEKTLHMLKENGGYFAWLDAIKDTVHQPFDPSFQKAYKPCISFKEALNRSWTKLQMRGLIGKKPFPVKDQDLKTLKQETFLKLAMEARSNSTSKERKELQKYFFSKLYSTISQRDIEMIKGIYKDDFDVFGYSSEFPNYNVTKTI